MLLIVLLFIPIDIIFGLNSSTSQSPSIVNTSSVHSFTIVTTTKFPITNVVSSNMSLKTTYNISSTLSTTQPRPSSSSGTQILSMTSSIAGCRGQTTSISYTPASFREAGTIQVSFPLTHTSFSSSIFSGRSFSNSKAFQTTPSTTTKTKKSTGKNPANVNVLGMNVKTGVLKYMFYGTSALAIVCIIFLIVVCCCWRRQTRTITKLERQDTTMSNPYVNARVEGFPSPLQLDSFVVKPESPYDTPETVPQEIDVSYVTVIDAKRNENDSESHYAAVKENGTVNSVEDSESRDNDPMPSPDYTNASVFEMDPYQELMPANRIIEDHYTSLINRDENKKDEATI